MVHFYFNMLLALYSNFTFSNTGENKENIPPSNEEHKKKQRDYYQKNKEQINERRRQNYYRKKQNIHKDNERLMSCSPGNGVGLTSIGKLINPL